MRRNRLLADAAAIGAVASLLDAVNRLDELSAVWALLATVYRATDVLSVIGAVLMALAFVVAWSGLRHADRELRLDALSTAAGCFAVAAVPSLVSDIIRTFEASSASATWKVAAAYAAFAAGRIAFLVAALLARKAFSDAAPDARMSLASAALAAYAGLIAVGIGIELWLYLGVRSPFSSGKFTDALGAALTGWAIVAVGCVLAANAFRVVGARRARGEAWQRFRAGELAWAAIVAAIGFVLIAVGARLQGGFGHHWLQGLSSLGLAAAAGCAAAAFLESRRRIMRRESEQGDGSDLPVLPDPR